ncbi:MAG: DUF3592 domain-containing protein [Lachnospiraceae bacterium]|nr:DUF3592 domain-containing protein [Lachnospiraceae bacterium]
MNYKKFKDLIFVLIICVLMTINFSVSYSSKMKEVKVLHGNKEAFRAVEAYGITTNKYRIENDDGTYSYRFDAKYVYEVDGKSYSIYSYGDTYVSNKIVIYYNPSNPAEYSYFHTYDDAIEPIKYIKIIRDLFFWASVIFLMIILYYGIFQKEYINNENYLIADDNISTNKEIKLDDNITMDTLNKIDKEYILDEYGLWVLDENYVDVDTRLNRTVIPIPDKEVVDKIATIPFVRKNNPDDIENIDFTEETETTENINEINTTEETSATEIMNETETTVTKQDNDIIFKLKENTYG